MEGVISKAPKIIQKRTSGETRLLIPFLHPQDKILYLLNQDWEYFLYGSFHFSIHKTKSFITQDWEYFFVWFFS